MLCKLRTVSAGECVQGLVTESTGTRSGSVGFGLRI